jgi:hypothetical protein
MLLALLPACTDYGLKSKTEEPDPPRDTATDTATVDTSDTTDSGDTNTGTVTDTEPEDTGPDDTNVATAPIYLNSSDTLYSYDPESNTTTRIGYFTAHGNPFGDVTDIAIDLEGHLFACTFDTLYRVNPTTAEATDVGPLTDSMTGLTFVSDGRLVGAGEAVSFVDTHTGALSPLVPRGRYTTSGDIIGLPDGYLYWTVEGGDDLVRIDPSNGETTDIGTTRTTGIFGLGFDADQLYGFTSGGRVALIDSDTGHVLGNRSLSGTWWGATTNPVLWR